MAPVSQWSKEEVIIAVYFTSRGVRPKSLRCLLKRRGFDRSCYAIKSKISHVLRRHTHLKGPKSLWDWRNVDQWIDDLLGDHELANTLISFLSEDADDIRLVSLTFHFHFDPIC